MGDRANVVIKNGPEQVCLYTHWTGTELPETLRSGMKRAKLDGRIDDFQYLNRIIFCEMIGAQGGDALEATTGFGITQKPWDGDDRIIEIDCEEHTVRVGDKKPVSFDAFMKSKASWPR